MHQDSNSLYTLTAAGGLLLDTNPNLRLMKRTALAILVSILQKNCDLSWSE